MFHSESAPRLRIQLAVGAGILLALLIGFLMFFRQGSPVEFQGLPLPLSVVGNPLKGAITFFENRGGIEIDSVTFDKGESREILLPDRVYLVHIPAQPDIQDVPLDLVFTTFTGDSMSPDYWGYQYSDAVGTAEIRDVHAYRFSDRFSGRFFSSKLARSNDASRNNSLTTFGKVNGITFLPTWNAPDGVRISPAAGGLYMIIVNQPGGLELHPRSSAG